MAKIIRATYPKEFSIGLLLLIFAISSFLSSQIFNVRWRDIIDGHSPYLGMFLSGLAVVFMVLILWEEFLFPARIKPTEDEIVFRNHSTKLQTQILIYCAIPVIVGFIYLNYEVAAVPFFIWAAICVISPVSACVWRLRRSAINSPFVTSSSQIEGTSARRVRRSSRTACP